MKLILIGSIFTLMTSHVWAWGGRGHDSICESAVYLVKNPKLKEYLQNKSYMMGHLCNIPDTHWKNISSEVRKVGDSAHFVDIEITGLKPLEIPLNYKDLIQKYTGAENQFSPGKKIIDFPKEFGSNWWRADQLYRVSLEKGQSLKKLEAPQNSKEEQNDESPFNKAFFEMIVSMGIMGHFVGDNSQPLHVTADYDGYATGNGGLHAYYEDTVVAYFGSDLHDRIVKKAKTFKSPVFADSKKSVLENMRALGDLSLQDLKKIVKLDPVITPSVLKIEKGMSLKTPAVRKSGEEGYKKMNEIIVTQMARSALLLAHLWDRLYVEAGEPNVKAYKSYKYPFTPDFITPDYYEMPADKVKSLQK